MDMTIRDSFNRAAPKYDALRRKLIPCFDDFYGSAVRLLADDTARVLDLGAGTGILSGAVRMRLPEARLDLVDLAEDMLAVARERFAGDDGVSFRVADYGSEDLGGPYDAVVSALSIHHLEHEGKQALFRRIRRALKPGGRFVNADQALGSTPSLEAWYKDNWVADIQALGIGDVELAAARHRQTHDRLAPLADQLAWMTDAGFAEVDCVYKNWSFIVVTGIA
jgi:tRNA (cmo5U34)-methyltransferase